jgi:ParB/RepB/Spo0J family partition protein
MPAKPQRQPMAQAIGLGHSRGVTSLFEDTSTPGTEIEGARLLPIDLIDPNPFQPRQAFDATALEELAASIREHGVLEPVLVRPVGERYQIVVGERRFQASRIAGQTDIPSIIRPMDDMEAAFVSTVENLQREDLDIEDEARRFAYLLELTGMSQRKLAEKLGINHIYLSRRVKLLKRPDLLDAYRAGLMTLHQVVSQADSGIEDAEADPETVSPGNNLGAIDLVERQELTEEIDGIASAVSLGNNQDDLELIEESETTYIVSRGNRGRGGEGVPGRQRREGSLFRWRPTMQFRNWLNRIDPKEVPPDERATLRAQITEIRAKLEEWEAALKEQS